MFVEDLKPGDVCQIKLKYFFAELKDGSCDSMSDQMKFLILSIKDEEAKYSIKKEIKFLYNGKIYTIWLNDSVGVLVIK